MKTMIFPVAGLLVGLLGGTLYGGMKEKNVLLAEKAALEAEAAEAEADTEEGDHLVEDTPGTEPASDPVHDEGSDAAGAEAGEIGAAMGPEGQDPALPEEEAAAPEVGPGPVGEAANPVEAGAEGAEASPVSTPLDSNPTEEVIPTTTDPSQTGESGILSQETGGSARMAKIFGAMKAPDAAKVLQNLDDLEVRAILSHLTDRKAAEILGNFEPERAAALSRLVLGSPAGGGP
jgi:hypothetical protein